MAQSIIQKCVFFFNSYSSILDLELYMYKEETRGQTFCAQLQLPPVHFFTLSKMKKRFEMNSNHQSISISKFCNISVIIILFYLKSFWRCDFFYLFVDHLNFLLFCFCYRFLFFAVLVGWSIGQLVHPKHF